MNRRDFLALSSATLIQPNVKSQEAQTPVAPPRPAGQTKPNILMIMADQLRMDCVGAYGLNKAIKTPNLDRIARDGVRFNNAYTCVPSCTPARTALMTGLGPWKNGMLGYGTMATKPYAVEKAKALADAGYYTTSIGKNHYFPITNGHGYHHLISDEHNTYWFQNEKDSQTQSPEYRCDYESWFWSQRPSSDPRATGLGWNDQPAKPFVYPEELHPTHWTGTTAVRFLEQYERPEPFFLKVSFIRPHSPYDPPQKYWDMYNDASIPEAQTGEWASRFEDRSNKGPSIWHGKLSPEEIRHTRQGYYGSVSHVDSQIGLVLAALEQRHMMDDTMIIFFSDHGDMLGDQNLWRKTYGYEQSAHIPMLLKPAKQQHLEHAPKTIDNPVEIRDVLPTLLDAAQTPIPDGLDGDSMCKLLRDPQTKWRDYIDLEHGQIFGPSNHWNGLTDGKWKYIFHAPTGEEQLFSLTEDRNELHDLAKQPVHAEMLTLWRGRMVEHLTERGPEWVQDGTLQIREKPQLYSPNFPGFNPSSYEEKTIAG